MPYRSGSRLTDPAYITPSMFERVIREKFQDNVFDTEVRDRAVKLLGLLRASGCQQQTLFDILHATEVSGSNTPERTAEIGFAMGLQFGFELALSYPPLS